MTKSKQPSIKTIIPTGTDYYAAFLPLKEMGIPSRVERVVCWSLIQFYNGDPDEVVGQIIVGSTIMETTIVDEDDGFGELFGYFRSIEEAKDALSKSPDPDDEEDEEEEEEEEEGDEDEGEEEDEEDEDEGDDEDEEDGDEDDEDDEDDDQ